MATAYKVLGQSNPTATQNTTLYTTPSGTSTVVSTIVVCNQTTTAATFRLIIQQSAEVSTTILAKQYVAYDVSVGGSDTTALTLGVTLATGDAIKVYASTATLSFMAFGSEIA